MLHTTGRVTQACTLAGAPHTGAAAGAVSMVRSYSLPVATQHEHDDQHRSLSMLRTCHCWWSGGWVASGNGMLDIPESSERDADHAAHRLLPQSKTRRRAHARAASAVPIPTTPENTSKQQSWCPRYMRKDAKHLLRDDTALADSGSTPDYWATSAHALEMHEPRIPTHMAAAMSGGPLMPCVVPQGECPVASHIHVPRAAAQSPLVES